MRLEEQLLYLNEEEIFGKEERVEVEGSKVLEHWEYLGRLLNEVADAINSKDTMLQEDMNLIDKTQMECIEKLGEIIDKINEM